MTVVVGYWSPPTPSHHTQIILNENLSKFGKTNSIGSLENLTIPFLEAMINKKVSTSFGWPLEEVGYQVGWVAGWGKIGSKLIIITREMDVGETIKTYHTYGVEDVTILDSLEDDGIWKIFKDHSFGRYDSSLPDYVEWIGKEIVKKLNDLSLAAKDVVQLLEPAKHEETHWKRI